MELEVKTNVNSLEIEFYSILQKKTGRLHGKIACSQSFTSGINKY